jgi:hypothetical protein
MADEAGTLDHLSHSPPRCGSFLDGEHFVYLLSWMYLGLEHARERISSYGLVGSMVDILVRRRGSSWWFRWGSILRTYWGRVRRQRASSQRFVRGKVKIFTRKQVQKCSSRWLVRRKVRSGIIRVFRWCPIRRQVIRYRLCACSMKGSIEAKWCFAECAFRCWIAWIQLKVCVVLHNKGEGKHNSLKQARIELYGTWVRPYYSLFGSLKGLSPAFKVCWDAIEGLSLSICLLGCDWGSVLRQVHPIAYCTYGKWWGVWTINLLKCSRAVLWGCHVVCRIRRIRCSYPALL